MFAKGPTVWLMLEPLWDRKPGEAQSVGPGPREDPGKVPGRPWEGLCGGAYIRMRIDRRMGLVASPPGPEPRPEPGPSQAQSPGTYELDIRQGPAKPRPRLDLGQGLGPGFTRVLPHGPRPGPQLGPSPGPGAPFKQPRAWAGLQCYRAGNERIGK